MEDKIIVLHEYGANSHYRALKYLLDKKQVGIEFYEFSIIRKIIESVFRIDIELFKKQIINIKNLISLTFSKNKKVLLGMAPYDYRLYFILFILRNHTIYYHTSWPYWDESSYPKKMFFSKYILKKWENFLQTKSKHIFAVSKGVKEELILHKNVEYNKISVVYHSYDSNIYYTNSKRKKNDVKRVLYVGRLTESKGIKNIINFFSTHTQNFQISFVGNGNLKSEVEKFARVRDNVKYYGFISDKMELAKIYNKADYLLLPSIKQENWEEAFGMVIIEAMACGVIPIATKHPGPLEIITMNIDGYLIDEEKIEDELEKLFNYLDHSDYMQTYQNVIKKAQKFTLEEISNRWRDILNG